MIKHDFHFQIDINSEMRTLNVLNHFFLESKSITLYNNAFRNCEFNSEIIYRDLTLFFTNLNVIQCICDRNIPNIWSKLNTKYNDKSKN